MAGVVTAELERVPVGCSAEWPAWGVPSAAVGEWLVLQLAIASSSGRLVCETSPEDWWAAKGTSAQVAAVEACTWCPVRVQCQEYAVAAREPHGVWGGTTPEERLASGRGC